MFDLFKKLHQTNKSVWQSSGYFADVILAFGSMTGQRLDKLLIGQTEKHLFDAFLADATQRGLTPKETATTIYYHGYKDRSVLTLPKHERESYPKPDLEQSPKPPTSTADFQNLKPVIPDMHEARRILDAKLAEFGLDFTGVQPMVYHSLIVEVSAIGNPTRTMEMLFEIVQGIKSRAMSPDEEEEFLTQLYVERTNKFLAAMAP